MVYTSDKGVNRCCSILMTDKYLHLDKTSTSALVKEEKLSKPEAEKSFFPLVESLKVFKLLPNFPLYNLWISELL